MMLREARNGEVKVGEKAASLYPVPPARASGHHRSDIVPIIRLSHFPFAISHYLSLRRHFKLTSR